MKYFKYLSIASCIFAMVAIFSCKKQEAKIENLVKTTGTAVFPNFAEILLNKADYINRILSKDGYISISLFNPIGVKSGNPLIYATFTDSTDRISYGMLSVNSYNLPYDKDVKAYDSFLDYKSSDYLKSLFGTFVTFKLKAKNGADDEALHEIYVPKSINVSAPFGSSINRNSTFVWDADGTNTPGVIIAVTFDPQISGNSQFKNVKTIERVIIAKDNGRYTFESQDLDGIPSGSTIAIALVRGNLAEIKGLKTGNNYLIYAKSTTGGTYVLN